MVHADTVALFVPTRMLDVSVLLEIRDKQANREVEEHAYLYNICLPLFNYLLNNKQNTGLSVGPCSISVFSVSFDSNP